MQDVSQLELVGLVGVGRLRAEGNMRVALIAEGCYPFVTGGVSTWSNQLVQGLSDHEFQVIAITATSRVRAVMALPENVTVLRTVPLWDWRARRRPAASTVRERFDRIYRSLLAATLDDRALQRGFDLALRELADFAHLHDLTAVFLGDEPVQALLELWPQLFPEVPLPVRDALHATELIEHMLLPLAARVPHVDVTHVVSNGLPALVGLAAKWRHGTPMVMSEHGVYLRERYLAFRSVEYRWPVKTVMLAFLRRMCRTAYRESDAITPVNVFNRRWEIRHGADPDRIRTVYNGTDAQTLPAAPGDPDRPTVGWIGRVDPLKDLHTLVAAFRHVADRVPQAVLRLFGPTPAGNEEYEASVRALVAELGLTDRVTFEGPVRPATTAYHASTVVALSSISEGLPYTVMEAMMCARATVSSDVGGVAEVTGSAGVVVPPRDPQRLGEALAELLLDDARRQDLATRARGRALEMFQLHTMLDTFRNLYREISSTGSRQAPALSLPRAPIAVPCPQPAHQPAPGHPAEDSPAEDGTAEDSPAEESTG